MKRHPARERKCPTHLGGGLGIDTVNDIVLNAPGTVGRGQVCNSATGLNHFGEAVADYQLAFGGRRLLGIRSFSREILCRGLKTGISVLSSC